MRSFIRADDLEDRTSSDEGVKQPTWPAWKKAAVGITALLAIAAITITTGAHFSQTCGNLGALERKYGKDGQLDVDAAVRATRQKLVSIKNQTLADELVMKTMVKAGQKAARTWEKHHVRKLDTLATITAIKTHYNGINKRKALNAECSFNILEAFVSVVGMGDDINGLIRVCPSPRDGESELACQVDGSILVAWVANAATKLALAASNCALSLNVDAVCSVGVTGLVSGFGEIAAGACLGAAVCAPTPPSLTTTKISELGDQTIRGRRLLIGEGTVGNGVQCGVDVGMVAANIANMGIAINKAVNINKCKASTFRSPLNVLKGIPEAICTIDIGGAVAYIGQVVTFINLIVVHCQDFLDVNALCAGSISAITTGAAAIAPYAAAVHVGCRYNHLLKTPKAVGKISALWNVPTVYPRRLTSDTEQTETEKPQPLEESLAHIAKNKELAKDLNLDVTRESRGESQANMETLLNLMSAGLEEEAPRAAWPFQQC